LVTVALQVILTALSVFSSVEAFLLNERWPSTMTRFLSILVDAEAGCDEVLIEPIEPTEFACCMCAYSVHYLAHTFL